MVSARIKKFVGFITLMAFLGSPLMVFVAESRFGDEIRSSEIKSEINTSSDDVPDVDLSELPEIDYDEIINPWYDSKVEMLIVTPNQTFADAITPLMEWKNQKGVKTEIVSDYTSFPGTDKAEKIRNLLKYYYENEDLQWVLLAGDAEESLIPIRYVYNPDVTLVDPPENEYSWGNVYKPTDFYYADLTGSWDDNENGEWGESSIYTKRDDEIDWTPEVYVGRFPADNAVELEQMVNKTLKYEINPYIGDWMNRMLLAGGISTTDPAEDEARLTQYIWQHYTILESNFNHLIRYTSAFTPDVPSLPNNQSGLTEPKFISAFNEGYSTVIFAGHGTPEKFNDAYISDPNVYLKGDAAASSNDYMPSLVYADACSTNAYDKTDDNIGETLIKRPNSGAIGYIGGLRVTWYFEDDNNLEMLNRGNAKLFWEQFFKEKKFQQGKSLFDSKVEYMESDYFTEGGASMDYEWERKNVLTYCLLGDPEIDIYTDRPTAAKNPITSDIYEAQLVSWRIYDANESPVPYARVNLKTVDGKYRTEYADKNGYVEFRLPPGAGEVFNITVTGHNLRLTNFNFTTIADETKPEANGLSWEPENPTVSENLRFSVNAYDSDSGIEHVFVLISNNDFESYNYEEMDIEEDSSDDKYNCSINKLKPDKYSVLIVARDYANNVEMYYDKDFEIEVPTPPMSYILFVIMLLVVGLTATSVVVAYKGRSKYLRTLERVSEKESLITQN